MRIVIILAVISTMLAGCEAGRQPEFWQTYDRNHQTGGGEGGGSL